MNAEIKEGFKKGYFLKNNFKEIVILFHGFGDTPLEMYALATFLHNYDYDVCVPCLPGHKSTFNDFNKVKHSDWLSFSENLYDYLHKKYKKIYLVGFSMGGCIALNLASKKNVEKVIVLATPVDIFDISFFVKNIKEEFVKHNINLEKILKEIKKISKRKKFSNFLSKIKFIVNTLYKKIKKVVVFFNKKKALKQYYESYDFISYNALKELLKLMSKTKKCLKKINTKLLVIHSVNDNVVPLTNANMIVSEVSSLSVEKFFVKKSKHHLLLDEDYVVVYNKISDFIKN